LITTSRKAISIYMYAALALSTVAEVRMGYPFRDRLRHVPAGSIAVVQMKDIDEDNLLHVEEATRVELPDLNKRHLICEGDLVFRSRGKTNSAVLVPQSIGPAVVAAPMFLIRPVNVLPAYLLWYINLPTTQAQLSKLAEGTSVQMISKSSLDGLEIPIPSLNQQTQIVEIATLAAAEQRLLENITKEKKRYADGVLMQYARNTRPDAINPDSQIKGKR
jgi:hypothetical protein